LGATGRQDTGPRSVAFTSQPGAPGAGGVPGVGPVRIIADKVKNALVILATPRDYRTMQSTIRKLDTVPLQVLVEATILEVRLNDALRYGVEWFFKFGGSNQVSFSTLPTGAVAPLFPGFSYLATPTQDSVRVVVNALDEVSDVNVISSPQVFVLDNQTASIQVGDQVPIATRSLVSVDNPDSITNSIEYRDTGVILNVTPRVNTGGLVTMEVAQEVSDVVETTSSTLDSPTIQTRRVESTVSVQSGQTVALGGLIRDSRTNGSTGVPYLSRIPVIGWLFGVKEDSADRTELLVLITPRVVANQDESRKVTEELRGRIRAVQPLEERIR
jgi:general secretion pathway protein D